jgi:hypothetical protein
MKALKIVLGLVLLVVVVFVVGGFTLPDQRTVIRSATINAPTANVYALTASLKNGWTQWSPFGEAQDPTMKSTYTGPDEGIAATQSFTGKQGAGTMKIVSADAAKGIGYQLSLMEGKLTIDGHMNFEPEGGGTKVIWSDDMKLDGPMLRWGGLMMDSMIGKQFEKGLASLKSKAEAMPAVPAPH